MHTSKINYVENLTIWEMPIVRAKILLAFIFLFGLIPKYSSGDSDPRFVVANWHIRMGYVPNEPTSENIENDIRAAIELGINGFGLNSFSYDMAQHYFDVFTAAADNIGAVNFKFFLSADMSGSFSGADIVKTITMNAGNPHYLKINGKPLLSTYIGAAKNNQWWVDNVIAPLQTAGHPVTFIPGFDRANPNGTPPTVENWKAVLQKFPVVDGLFNFMIPGSPPFRESELSGLNHLWSSLDAEENLSSALSSARKLFIAPYIPYYWATCHSVRQVIESQGGQGMANIWESIINTQNPVGVEIATWNDYTESHYLQPTQIPITSTPGITSFSHLGYYELLKYYVNWYLTGAKPEIAQDAVFYIYRTSPLAAAPTNVDPACSLGPVPKKYIFGDFKDAIYVTTAALAPSTLKVTSGTSTNYYHVPAGLYTTAAKFSPGRQVMTLMRNGVSLVRGQGMDIAETSAVTNFNQYSGYAFANGVTSDSWVPSDAWKQGFVPSWFRPAATN